MKADKFDDAIRKKLESIVPSQSEQDIEKVHQFVKLNRPPTFWGQYGSLVSFTAVAGIVASMVVIILTQRYENTHLQNQLAKIQQTAPTVAPTLGNSKANVEDTLQKLPMPQSASGDEGLLIQKNNSNNQENEPNSISDKEATKNQPINSNSTTLIKEKSSVNNPSLVAKNVEKTGISKVENQQLITRNSEIKPENSATEKVLNSKNITKNFAQKDLVDDAYLTDNTSVKVSKNQKLKRGKTIQNTATEPIPDFSPKMNETIASEKNEPNKVLSEKLMLNSLFNKGVSMNNLVNMNPKMPQTLLPVSNADVQVGGWNISFKNITYRVGLGMDFGRETIGRSFVVDAFLTERFSINTGVRLLSYHGDIFDNEMNFRMKKAQDFRALYAPRLLPNQDIKNIDMQDFVVQIPINLAYHIPLKSDFSIITSLGTDLDLSAKKNVKFEYRDLNSSYPHPEVKDSVQNARLFNNLTASVGIQKQVNRFVFQATPYLSKQLTDISYKESGFQWGVRLRVLYDFGRK